MRCLQGAICSIGLHLITTWIAVVPAFGATPSDAVPESASLVVRWKSPQATAGKVADFVDSVQPGYGALVKAYLPEAGRAIGIPGLKGVDLDQDIIAIVFAEPNETPEVVYVVSATDVESLEKTLSSEYEVHVDGKMVVYAEEKDTLNVVVERLSSKGGTLWSKIDAGSMKTFNDGDISVMVNVKQMAEDFAEDLKEAEPKLDELIDQIANAMPSDQQQFAAFLDVYRQLGKSAIATIHDTNSYAVAVTFSKVAIRYEDRLQVAEGTQTAKFFSSQPAAELTLMNQLPANKSVYLGSSINMTNFAEWGLKMTKSMLTDLSEEQTAKFESAAKEMQTFKYGEMAVYFDLNDSSPGLRAGSVTKVTPIDRVRELSRQMTKLMSEVRLPTLKQTTTLDTNVDKIGGVEVDRITIKQEFENVADPFGIQKMIHKAMFGDAGMTQHVLYQKDRTLQTMGGGVDELKSVAKALEAPKATESDAKAPRKRFVDKSHFVALIDLSRLVVSGLKLAAEQTKLPFDVKVLDKMNLPSSFISYSLSFEANSVRSQLELPAMQFQNIAKTALTLQSQ